MSGKMEKARSSGVTSRAQGGVLRASARLASALEGAASAIAARRTEVARQNWRLRAEISSSIVRQEKPARRRQPSYFKMFGRMMIERGFEVIPVRRNSKIPAIANWAGIEICIRQFERHLRRFASCSIGIRTKNTPAIDIDCDDRSLVDQVRQEIFASIGETMERIGREPRTMLVYRTTTPFRKVTSSVWLDNEGREQKLEVLGDGQQAVAHGHHPDTGLPYSWRRDRGHFVAAETHVAELPNMTEEDARRWCARFDELAVLRGWTRLGSAATSLGPVSLPSNADYPRLPLTERRFVEAVMKVPDAADYTRWITVGMAIHHQMSGSDAGLKLWKRWSQQAENYEEHACEAHWPSFSSEGKSMRPVTGRTILHLTSGKSSSPHPEEACYELNEDGLAAAFAARHRQDLKFDHHTGRWMWFDGALWRIEETKLAFSYAREISRDLRVRSPDLKTVTALAKASTAAAVEKFAQSDRLFAVTSEVWDQDPFLLGTPGGTVDLKTGVLRPPRREDYITKSTAVAPVDVVRPANIPTFLRFLDEVTSGDPALIRFIQQFGGYCLTGDIREHSLLFIYGPGGNGKSVLQNTLAEILMDYSAAAPIEAFTSSRSDRHPTELAMLRGKRLVTASETETGKTWAEVRIKQMTGGDKIPARFMRQDFFEFSPQFKLFFVGNNKPSLSHVDEAARRRFLVMEFGFRPLEPDKGLLDKLRPEWPGILRWLIDGCIDWQRNGLVRPDAILKTTEQYFQEQDKVQEWLDECCQVGPRFAESYQQLSLSFEQFISSRACHAQAYLPDELKRRGFESFKNKFRIRGRGYSGLRLLPDDD